jgi:hypothetical protein
MSFDERPRDLRSETTGLSYGTYRLSRSKESLVGCSAVGWLEDMTGKLDPFLRWSPEATELNSCMPSGKLPFDEA